MIIKHRYIINLFLYVGMYSAALLSSQAAEIEDFTKYVNPFIQYFGYFLTAPRSQVFNPLKI